MYILETEIALLAPRVASDTLLADPTGQLAFILQATAIIDGAMGQSLMIRRYYDEDIKLDQNFSGRVRRTPHLGWLDSNGLVGAVGRSPESVALADFTVEPSSGIIRNLSAQSGTWGDEVGFRSPDGSSSYQSAYGAVARQYHVSNPAVVQDNSRPYVLRASYLAGWFCEQVVDGAIVADATTVKLKDVTGVQRGHEFYFSSDIENEPSVDREITAVDTTTKIVTFTPALVAGVADLAKFRMIDRVVRSACADVIEELITYPPNTKDFSEGLGRGDLSNRWMRLNNGPLPLAAAYKLGRYVR